MADSEIQVRPVVASEQTEPPQKSLVHKICFLVTCVFAGVVFGFALEKGRVFEPDSIRLQMVFEKWIMMKMFLAAMGTGTLILGILSLIPSAFIRERFAAAEGGMEKVMATKNVLSIICGTFTLGVGMSIAGACPGMVLPQVGAWAKQAIFTFIGALIGNLCYGLLHDSLYQKIFPSETMTFTKTRFHQLIGVRYGIIALVMGVVVLAAVVGLEFVVPWKSDLRVNLTESHNRLPLLGDYAWPPAICGVLIGVLQAVFVLSDGHTLGGSGAYNTIVAQLMVTESLRTRFPYLAGKRCGLGNFWQPAFMLGAVTGGLGSALLSESLGTTPGVPILYALVGGFLLLFGARLAAGCTSGHGLSGSGLLVLASFLGVPAMFAGAIITAVIMKFAGVLNGFCDNYCFV